MHRPNLSGQDGTGRAFIRTINRENFHDIPSHVKLRQYSFSDFRIAQRVWLRSGLATEGAGPMTLSIDIGAIKLILAHYAARRREPGC